MSGALTDRIVWYALTAPVPSERPNVSVLEVVQHLAGHFQVDEADVLRALAELEQDGWWLK